MDEIERWHESKPSAGRFINLYRSDSDHAVFCKVVIRGFFIGVEGSQVGDSAIPGHNDCWCYVPEPPDWDEVRIKTRAESVARNIGHLESELEKLKSESEDLAEALDASGKPGERE